MDKSDGKSPRTYTLEEIDAPNHPPRDRQDEDRTVEEDFLADYLVDMEPLPAENDPVDGSNQIVSLTGLIVKEDVQTPNEGVGDEVAANIPTEEEASRALVVWRNPEEHANRVVSTHPQHERLRGWRIEERPRQNIRRIDKFYIHLISDIQFRSLNEVDDFVHLGFHPRRRAKGQTTGGTGEGTSEKRSRRRTLSWEFELKGILNDGISKVYDIRFLQPTANQEPNFAESSRARHGSPSSEETLSDHGVKQEQAVGHNRPTMKEQVETFLRDAYENLMNSGKVDSDKTEEEVHEDTSQNVVTSSANPSRDKGKRKKYDDDDDDKRRGSKSKKPRI